MIIKINYLKSLAFPDKEIKAIQFGENSAYQQYAMAPNLVRISIGDLYKEVPGFVESLSFEIDDNTTWANSDEYTDGSNTTFLYPSVIDVSIGIKIIEEHIIEEKSYKYDFDGRQRVKDREIKQIMEALKALGVISK